MPAQNLPQGFAAMTPERRREVASKGGSSVPASSRSFTRNPELAREAGRKGGKAKRLPALPQS